MPAWREIGYLKHKHGNDYKFHLQLPEPLCNWDVYDYWERPRTESLKEHLTIDDILYDVGSEHGWLSAVYSYFTQLFLIEPTREFWPNIRETFIRNRRPTPLGFYNGLVGAEICDINFAGFSGHWPECSSGSLIDKNKYQYLHSHESNIVQTTIDHIVQRSGIKPTAITIDVEGAELLVLKGMKNTLEYIRPKIWISIHPDLALRDYATTEKEIFDLLNLADYRKEHLGTDHEQHWLFMPREL